MRATAAGTEAVASFRDQYPDLLVLDIGLPDADGRDVCQTLRARGMTAPVIFLTARDALTDRLSGFKVGGDDYLIKPFALAELIVRIEAALRRVTSSSPGPGRGSRARSSQHGVAGPGGHVSLTPTEFRILATLASDQGSVVRRSHAAGGGLARRCDRQRQHPRCLRFTASRQAARSRDRAADRQRARRRLRAAMKIRTRLLIVSLVTLAVGLGLLLVLGNLLFAATINGQTQRLLATRADAQVAALTVRPAGVSVRPTHNDGTLDGRAWIFDRHRVLERPSAGPGGGRPPRGLAGLAARPVTNGGRSLSIASRASHCSPAAHPTRSAPSSSRSTSPHLTR